MKTSYDRAVEEAEAKTKIAREAMVTIGRMTPRVEKLIDEADKAWLVVERILGNESSKS